MPRYASAVTLTTLTEAGDSLTLASKYDVSVQISTELAKLFSPM